MDEIKVSEQTKSLIVIAEQLGEKYQKFEVQTNEEYSNAFSLCREIKNKYNDLEAKRREITTPLDETKKRIMELFRKPLDILSNAERIIKGAAIKFQNDQEIIRQAEERRLRAIQEKEAERLRKRVVKAEEKGQTEKAEQLKEQANFVETTAPVVQTKVDEIEGVFTKILWRHKIIDATKIPREYLIPDDKKLSDLATTTKGTLKIEGVEFYSEQSNTVKK